MSTNPKAQPESHGDYDLVNKTDSIIEQDRIEPHQTIIAIEEGNAQHDPDVAISKSIPQPKRLCSISILVAIFLHYFDFVSDILTMKSFYESGELCYFGIMVGFASY